MHYITQQEKLNSTKTIGDNWSGFANGYFTWTWSSIVQVPGNLIRNGPSSKKFQPLDLPGGCEEADASLNTFLARRAAFPVWIPPLCLNFCSREIICTAEKQCAKNSLPKPTESYLASNGRCSLWSALPLAKLELWWKGFQIRKCENPEKKSAVNGVTLSAALSSRTLETIENIKSLISERRK